MQYACLSVSHTLGLCYSSVVAESYPASLSMVYLALVQ